MAPAGMMQTMFDIDEVEALLRAAARRGHGLSYSEALQALGLHFTRPKMRALCKLLDAIDDRAAAAGEPELAVLVVRESDGLPGQGWWVNRPGAAPWTGPAAREHVRAVQQLAFDWWRER
ncbi:ribose-phosphate pyrophosphokinase [alpha proteobacterium AAP81b]|nr:ribose-phosphate pyrophosphokinase [alpha proteobacterium AAP81b]